MKVDGAVCIWTGSAEARNAETFLVARTLSGNEISGEQEQQHETSDAQDACVNEFGLHAFFSDGEGCMQAPCAKSSSDFAATCAILERADASTPLQPLVDVPRSPGLSGIRSRRRRQPSGCAVRRI